ncbi:MAG TPA: DMT family transporter [Acidimicrobiia bacterium]|nr:DMT family transporter [Acidimicrobiia bacterium]
MRRYAAEGALVLAAFLFGVTFPLVHDALGDVQPFAYLVLRFAIAVVVLAPFAIAIGRSRGEDRRALLRAGLLAGVLLGAGYAAQTVGLARVSPSTSAFITGLYVVLTPVVESIVRRAVPPRAVIAGGLLAAFGLYLLTGATVAVGSGELLTLACAVLFAVWIVYQGEYANRFHPIPFTTVQMAVIVVICLPPAAAQGVGHLTGLALFAAAFTGIFCSAVALSLQVFGQRRLPPSRTALILMLEPVFAAIAGFVNGERLTAVELAGAAVILTGIAIAELATTSRARRDHPELEPHIF